MNKDFFKTYFVNILNLLLICFTVEIVITLLFNYPNKNAHFSGINIWSIFIFYLIYEFGKLLKNDSGKFTVRLVFSFIILFVIGRYFTIFDIIESNYYGYKTKLFDFMPVDYDVKNFIFWQTGIASGYNYEQHTSNKLITFLTVPPIALFECLIKAIFPNLYILILIQLPIILFKRNILNWKSE